MSGILLDTDVLIDLLRGNAAATEYVESLKAPSVSSITVVELYAGVREGQERIALDRLIQMLEVIEVNEEIAVAGGLLRRDYGPNHGVGLNDAIIAATARMRRQTLITLNKKHFPMLADIIVPYIKT